ncbi:MAG: hypothetical protein Q8Q30_02015 [Candidatus Woesebacteria bacterium]|nr:hypothetical protein [Candidatus Woesebacteria bacterium]
MTVADARIVSDTEREAYLKELYQKIVEEKDQTSLKQLISIAAGRNDLPLARERMKAGLKPLGHPEHPNI